MVTRFIAFILTTTLSLYAQPDIASVKQAVTQNPALLETPQAKVMMSEKGISAEEVKQQIYNSKNMQDNNLSIEDEIVVNEISEITETTEVVNNSFEKNASDSAKRVKPFSYIDNGDVISNLNSKQQFLQEKKLTRYSLAFFANKNSIDTASLPTPDDYIITSSDVLNVHIYGDRNENYTLNVKNDGSVELAFIGPVQIGGMRYIDAKNHLEKSLSKHFKMSSFNISMNKYSSIQVTLIGEVKAPGIYNLSSFSTIKDLLINANGVLENGSIRDIHIKRNGKVVAALDFYDVLFDGKDLSNHLLKHGDIVVINRAKKLVSIDGVVNHSAIFELRDGEKLDKALYYAGGLKANASALNIKVNRFSKNSKTETFELTYEEAKTFELNNGDSIYVYPLDFSAQNSVNIYGNIIRPGSYNLTKNSTLNELLNDALKGGKEKFFLPQTHFEYAIVKSNADDLTQSVKSFNLLHLLDGTQTLTLKAKDEIYIYAHQDIFNTPYITTIGSILKAPGKYQFMDGMSIKDAINASGINGLIHDTIRVTTFNTENYMPLTKFYSLKNEGDTKIFAYDEIETYDYYSKNVLNYVNIKGEVNNPTSIYHEEGMSLEKLVNAAGGFTQKAYKNRAEIVRYEIDEKSERVRKIVDLDLNTQELSDITLKPFDEVTIFKIPKWDERETITLSGRVKFPGVYQIETGEKLSSVIKRAGGFNDDAFIEGTVFTRESIKNKQIEQYNEYLDDVKKQLTIYNSMPANAKVTSTQTTTALNEVIADANRYKPIGRISVKLDKEISKIEASSYDLVLKNGDKIAVPSSIDTITVFGEVRNPSSYIYDSAKNSADYILMASGFTRAADEGGVYVIHADGTSEPITKGWYSSSVDVKKGDTIVVPIHIKETNNLELFDSISRIFSNFALTAAALNSLGVTD